MTTDHCDLCGADKGVHGTHQSEQECLRLPPMVCTSCHRSIVDGVRALVANCRKRRPSVPQDV